MKLTANFTLEELTRSATATRLKIDNTPTQPVLNNLTTLAKTVLQPIRDAWGAPIIVTSGYRSPAVNSAQKNASKTSQHMTGAAADIRTVEDTKSRNKQLFDLICKLAKEGKISCRQIIDEYDYDWIHVAIQDSSHSVLNNNILHIR